MNVCLYCFSQTKNKKYCSVKCTGFDRRGKGVNHIRITVGTDKDGKRIRKYLHRHIVETQIRPLKAGEVVHHIDENKFNNSLDNLQILENQTEHKLLHHRLDKEKRRKALESSKGFDVIDGVQIQW